MLGELVGMLWDAGDIVGAIEVETLRNDLVTRGGVALSCAYPAEGGADHLDSLCGICACHTSVDDSAELFAHEEPGSDAMSIVFVPHRGAVLREFTSIIPDATLLASEIATNAVIHAGTPFRMTITRRDGVVRIAVADGDETMPVRRNPSPSEPGGRGLALVDMVTSAWGAEAEGPGKVVWAEIAVSG